MKQQTILDSKKVRVLKRCNNGTIMFIGLLFFWAATYAQDIKITGSVQSKEGIPIPGANIIQKGTKNGVMTDFDGNYSITVPPNSILVASYVGMKTEEIPVNNRNVINISLSPDINQLEELVVIGYGKQSRKTITTAISKVGADLIENVPVTSVSNALQGKLAGVRIYQSDGGQPGSDASIRIRGGASINKSNAPLVIIDGMQRSLNDINPNDIETVQVLKDASSTAIYGARASNGVVLVTTKSGKYGEAQITFNANTGYATPWKTMDMVGAKDYLRLVREAANRSKFRKNLDETYGWGTGNGSGSPFSTRYLQDGESIPEGYYSMIDPLDSSKTLIFQDNDFQDLTYNPGLEQKYDLSANGGSEKIKYFASLGYSDIEGTAIGTFYNRFNGRANVDFVLNENFTLSTRMDHSSSKSNSYPDQQDIFNRSIWLAPTAKVRLEDGAYAAGHNRTFTNPLWYNDVNKTTAYDYRTGVGASLTWGILEGLEAEISGDYYLRNRTFERFEKANVYRTNRNAIFNYTQNKRYQFEGVLTYNKDLGENHHINAVAGFSTLTFDDLDSRSQAEGANSDLIMTLNAAPLKLDASSDRGGEALLGIFSRVNYNFKEKYLLGLSLRRDASSLFAKENRVGYFPAASAGWVISEEQFMQNLALIKHLKLRASLGQTGNNAVNRYAYAGIYQPGYNYNGIAGFFPSEMPNQSLRWETTTQWDIGLDFGLFTGDRVNILFDYYNKVTSDLLFNVPLPNESGFNNIDQNIGKVKFYGYEIEVNADVINNTSFKWNAYFNLGYNMNRVLELPDNGVEKNRIGGIYNPDGGSVGGIAEGERLYSVTGYLSDHIIDTWEEAENANWDSEASGWSPLDEKSKKGRKIPGDMEWVDINGDGIIDEYDKVVLGYTVPTTTGGFGNTFTYGNFELNIFMDFALGHSIPDEVIRRSYGNLISGETTPLKEGVNKFWTEEGDIAAGNASLPRFDIMDNKQQSNYVRPSDMNVYKGDYLSLREMRLGYKVPAAIISKLKVSSLRFTLSGQNLHYFTEYPGWTPEYSSNGGNYKDNTYPVPRKIMLGINLGF